MRRDLLAAGLALGVAIPAQAAPPDPNTAGVQAVCGRCHTADRIYTTPPKSWERWNAIFAQMVKLGAKGSEAQIEQVQNYVLDHLTVLNVNRSTPDELQWVLQIDDPVVQQIVARREKKPFANLAEVGAVPGVDRKRLELLKPRIQF